MQTQCTRELKFTESRVALNYSRVGEIKLYHTGQREKKLKDRSHPNPNPIHHGHSPPVKELERTGQRVKK